MKILFVLAILNFCFSAIVTLIDYYMFDTCGDRCINFFHLDSDKENKIEGLLKLFKIVLLSLGILFLVLWLIGAAFLLVAKE